MMRLSTVFGFCLAGSIAAGAYVAAWRFENDWFMRAAPQKAADCFNQRLSCRELTWWRGIPSTEVTTPPRSALCHKPAGWHRIYPPYPGRTTPFAVCRDEQTYLFHLGIFGARYGNGAQWAICAEPDCVREMTALLMPR
ncbi:MAG: hypothetical protein P4L57_02600 [Rhizomicrobium sp.]|nr:hypothetical protein [Rhizomicrobium sp.]